MLKIIGRATIPRLAKQGIDALIERECDDLAFSEVVDMALQETDTSLDELGQAARRQLVAMVKGSIEPPDHTAEFRCGMRRPEGSILLFRNVTPHADTGSAFRLFARDAESRSVRAATLGTVLRGTCAVHLHTGSRITKTVRLRAGDVYVLDQSVNHSVSAAKTICVHLSVSMTLAAARRTTADPTRRFASRARK